MRRTRRQDAFSLVSAVFLLVVVTTAAAFMVRLVGVERTSVTFSWQGARAFAAAQSGIEWGSYRALRIPGACPGPPVSNQFVLSEGGLQGFQVTVVCRSDSHNDGPDSETRFHLRSTAEWKTFGDRDYVSRRVESTLSAVN